MGRETRRQQAGFTILETTVVVLVAGVIMAFAAPKITNAMREYLTRHQSEIALRLEQRRSIKSLWYRVCTLDAPTECIDTWLSGLQALKRRPEPLLVGSMFGDGNQHGRPIKAATNYRGSNR